MFVLQGLHHWGTTGCTGVIALTGTHLLVPQPAPFAKHVLVLAGKTDKFSLKESNVEAGGVVVDKLEQEHLHGQPVLILMVGFGNLCTRLDEARLLSFTLI